jgi:hypothetical protein
MTPDERKTYNKSYYEKRKVEIIKNGCLKVQCEFCLKHITNNRLLKHYETVNCSNRIKLNKIKELRKKELNNIL